MRSHTFQVRISDEAARCLTLAKRHLGLGQPGDVLHVLVDEGVRPSPDDLGRRGAPQRIRATVDARLAEDVFVLSRAFGVSAEAIVDSLLRAGGVAIDNGGIECGMRKRRRATAPSVHGSGAGLRAILLTLVRKGTIVGAPSSPSSPPDGNLTTPDPGPTDSTPTTGPSTDSTSTMTDTRSGPGGQTDSTPTNPGMTDGTALIVRRPPQMRRSA